MSISRDERESSTFHGLHHSVRAMVVLCLCMTLVHASFLPAFCYAEEGNTYVNPGGVELTDVQFGASGDSARFYKVLNGDFSNVHPHSVDGFPLVYLMFNKNVAFARSGEEAGFVSANVKKVHLRYADGREVEDSVAASLQSSDERRIIALYAPSWLDPLTEYQIVIDEGIMAANGIDVTNRAYTVDFKTGPECADGMTVYEKGALVLFGVALGAGVCIAIVRRILSSR